MEVYARDGGCVGPLLGAPGICRGRFGQPVSQTDWAQMTFEHVQDGGTGSMGLRATHDPQHGLTLCPGHGIQRWELGHKPLLRLYLKWVQTFPAIEAARRALLEFAADQAALRG